MSKKQKEDNRDIWDKAVDGGALWLPVVGGAMLGRAGGRRKAKALIEEYKAGAKGFTREEKAEWAEYLKRHGERGAVNAEGRATGFFGGLMGSGVPIGYGWAETSDKKRRK